LAGARRKLKVPSPLEDLRNAEKLAYGLKKRVELGRALALDRNCCFSKRADGRHEPKKRGHGPLFLEVNLNGGRRILIGTIWRW
jgi:hypothetical protein